jgi:hypothetical protein
MLIRSGKKGFASKLRYIMTQHVVCKKVVILLRVSKKIFSNLVTKITHSV